MRFGQGAKGYSIKKLSFDEVVRGTLQIPDKVQTRTAKEKRRLRSAERDMLVRLEAIRSMTASILLECDGRFDLVDGLRRDMKLLENLEDRVMMGLLATAPEEQIENILLNISGMSYIVGAKVAGTAFKYDDYGVYMTHNQMATIVGALEDHCLVCQRESWADEKACPVRKALDAIGSDVEHDGQCGYRLM